MTEATLLLYLLAAHWICDYPLQGDYLARAKGDFSSGELRVYHLAAHAGIHGGAVTLITGNIWLGLIEWVLHGLIDEAKVRGKTTFGADQGLHIICKVFYVAFIAVGLA